jgi:hypothetical protein
LLSPSLVLKLQLGGAPIDEVPIIDAEMAGTHVNFSFLDMAGLSLLYGGSLGLDRARRLSTLLY